MLINLVKKTYISYNFFFDFRDFLWTAHNPFCQAFLINLQFLKDIDGFVVNKADLTFIHCGFHA